MNLPKELQELLDKRTKLEDESRSLKEEQRKLEENARALEEKLIKGLKNNNEATRQNISQLESKIKDLEQRLGQISQESGTPGSADETTQEAAIEVSGVASDEVAEEKSVTVTAFGETPEEGRERKKHRFF